MEAKDDVKLTIINASSSTVSGVLSSVSTKDFPEFTRANLPILIDNYPTSTKLL